MIPYDLLILLDPPLAIKAGAIQEVSIQDDHLDVVEEEEAMQSLQSRYRPSRRVWVAPSSLSHSSVLFSLILLLA